MKFRSSLVPVVCRVTEEDIAQMLDDYDSGMTNFITQNAVSRALRRLLITEGPVCVREEAGDGRRFLEVADYALELPEPVCQWLHRAETNHRVRPFEFQMALPVEILRAELVEAAHKRLAA